MRVLIIGLGSMGKRRVRNFQAIGGIEVEGFDLRQDRRQEAGELYAIEVCAEVPDFKNYDAIVISSPPDHHLPYMVQSLDANRPCFVEASVIRQGLPELLRHPNFSTASVVPSCTLRFHPAVVQINRLVKSQKFGRITSFSFHCGQYLPDWHPWEDISEFYVSRRETGACREIIPYELTWLVDVLGFPREVVGIRARSGLINADIDDVYGILMDYGHAVGTLLVDVTSRYATRSLVLNLERAQLRWNWEEKRVWLYDAELGREVVYSDPQGTAARGYNPNLIEEMYVSEISAFLSSINGGPPFPNTLEEDIKILELLERSEAGHTTSVGSEAD